MIKRVRSTYGRPVETNLVWHDDDFHPWTIVDGVLFRDTGNQAFTQYVKVDGQPISGTQAHPNILAAFASCGWEPA
jgi:hypothetical protein